MRHLFFVLVLLIAVTVSNGQSIKINGDTPWVISEADYENITISYPGGGTEAEANAVVAEDINRYPEQYFFGVLPAWGAYIRHAKNVQFKNVKMTTRNSDAREMIVLDDVEGFVNN